MIEHNVIDAESSSNHTLKIRFDKHGLTIRLSPFGHIVVNLSGERFSVYADTDEAEMLKIFEHRIVSGMLKKAMNVDDHIDENPALDPMVKLFAKKIAKKHRAIKVLQGTISSIEKEIDELSGLVPMIVTKVVKPFATYDINDEIIFVWAVSENLPTGGGYLSLRVQDWDTDVKTFIYNDVSANLETIKVIGLSPLNDVSVQHQQE